MGKADCSGARSPQGWPHDAEEVAAPIVGDMITSTIHVLILVPVFFVMMKERELRKERIPSGKAILLPA